MTLPSLDRLRRDYPQAKITCLVPPRPKEIFIDNPAIERVVIFDKHSKLTDKINLFFSLSRERFDTVVDMRNSFFGAFLPAKKRSSPLRFIPRGIKHMKDRHLFWAGFSDYSGKWKIHQSLVITAKDVDYIDNILNGGIAKSDNLIVVAPGARSQIKSWDKHNFSLLCSQLIKEGHDVVLVGDNTDQSICTYVQQNATAGIFNLCGKTTIGELAALLKKAKFLITNDSAVMHLASYLNVPVAAIFGPTDEKKYGPWSEQSIIIKKDIFCRPCQKATCRSTTLACLASIKPEDVLNQIQGMFEGAEKKSRNKGKQYQRILIARTDRIGDVILSTPVIHALRQKFPQAYISMAVAPHAREIVEGNPYLDEVIIYDKDGKHKSWWRTLKFASRLKKKKFDLAIILHPTNRLHLIAYLAAIPQRLGYDRKLGFLLNCKKKHTKQEGRKHEAEYNLDLLSGLGVTGDPQDLLMPIRQESEQHIDELFRKNGLSQTDKILAINPGASCPSKIWPAERFAEVVERLVGLYDFKILILSGPKEIYLADQIANEIKGKVVNLAGKTSVSQLASILKRCTLFISNDSGPVHIASAVGTLVISIFGRNQAGLSPLRWGPLGKHGKYLHKSVGCIQCLAHNCTKEFACLKAITVEDVLKAVKDILSLN